VATVELGVDVAFLPPPPAAPPPLEPELALWFWLVAFPPPPPAAPPPLEPELALWFWLVALPLEAEPPVALPFPVEL
jgi:hypothetical protein